MEYTTIWQPMLLIFVSFSIGLFTGALWMFFIIHKSNKRLEQELDSKSRLLTTYENSLNHPEDD
tara:strand:+ start:349 stop:540 length:192 start_codon:yes stop_codon:yes gene_type:complete